MSFSTRVSKKKRMRGTGTQMPGSVEIDCGKGSLRGQRRLFGFFRHRRLLRTRAMCASLQSERGFHPWLASLPFAETFPILVILFSQSPCVPTSSERKEKGCEGKDKIFNLTSPGRRREKTLCGWHLNDYFLLLLQERRKVDLAGHSFLISSQNRRRRRRWERSRRMRRLLE